MSITPSRGQGVMASKPGLSLATAIGSGTARSGKLEGLAGNGIWLGHGAGLGWACGQSGMGGPINGLSGTGEPMRGSLEGLAGNGIWLGHGGPGAPMSGSGRRVTSVSLYGAGLACRQSGMRGPIDGLSGPGAPMSGSGGHMTSVSMSSVSMVVSGRSSL
jgi:hypothetical protein